VADGLLSYDGTTYRLTAAEVETLLARGVIVVDPLTPSSFELARDHLIEELGSDPVVVDHETGAEARREGTDEVRQRMLAVRYMHRDGQGRG
jgi:alkylhydroperoxidase family enzyme